jgi:hypothetical protein
LRMTDSLKPERISGARIVRARGALTQGSPRHE